MTHISKCSIRWTKNSVLWIESSRLKNICASRHRLTTMQKTSREEAVYPNACHVWNADHFHAAAEWFASHPCRCQQACQLSVAIRWIENGGPRTHKSSKIDSSDMQWLNYSYWLLPRCCIGKKWQGKSIQISRKQHHSTKGLASPHDLHIQKHEIEERRCLCTLTNASKGAVKQKGGLHSPPWKLASHNKY